jgi:uncharacterized protein (TIGR02117 family)
MRAIIFKPLAYATTAIFVAVIVYVVAAIANAVLPIAGRDQAAILESVPFYVCADAVHADFVMPLHDVNAGWENIFSEVATSDKRASAYISIGWGDLVFFTDIPSWGDVRPQHVASLFTGQNPVALRVLAVREPIQSDGCIVLQIDEVGKQALIGYIKQSVVSSGHGLRKFVSPYEAYYATTGRYGPLHTCNQWIADGLGAAGLSHAWFAPFSFGVTWPLGHKPSWLQPQ